MECGVRDVINKMEKLDDSMITLTANVDKLTKSIDTTYKWILITLILIAVGKSAVDVIKAELAPQVKAEGVIK